MPQDLIPKESSTQGRSSYAPAESASSGKNHGSALRFVAASSSIPSLDTSTSSRNDGSSKSNDSKHRHLSDRLHTPRHHHHRSHSSHHQPQGANNDHLSPHQHRHHHRHRSLEPVFDPERLKKKLEYTSRRDHRTKRNAMSDADREREGSEKSGRFLEPVLSRKNTRVPSDSALSQGMADIEHAFLANRKQVNLDYLKRVAAKRKERDESARTVLSSVADLSTSITRRLDYTYYNLLGRISSLYSTINSFQELYDHTRNLHNDFELSVISLDRDTRRNLDELKGFEPQVRRIQELESRMRAGRDKVAELETRLTTVQGKIDRWEQREGEWQARISRRLRILWAIIAVAILIFVAALASERWPSWTGTPDPRGALNQSRGTSLLDRLGEMEPVCPNPTTSELASTPEEVTSLAETDNTVLRILDEL